MKIIFLLLVFILNSGGFSNETYCQDCSDFYKTENCRAENSEGFKLCSLSRKYFLKVGTTVTYEVVFMVETKLLSNAVLKMIFILYDLKSKVQKMVKLFMIINTTIISII